jgi:hypothetical protein
LRKGDVSGHGMVGEYVADGSAGCACHYFRRLLSSWLLALEDSLSLRPLASGQDFEDRSVAWP